MIYGHALPAVSPQKFCLGPSAHVYDCEPTLNNAYTWDSRTLIVIGVVPLIFSLAEHISSSPIPTKFAAFKGVGHIPHSLCFVEGERSSLTSFLTLLFTQNN